MKSERKMNRTFEPRCERTTTYSITTLSITMLSIMNLIAMIGLTTLSFLIVMPHAVLSVALSYGHAECHYVEHFYGESRGAIWNITA
jgi:hypothetical protein